MQGLQNTLYYAEQKSKQNVENALSVCAEDFVLDSPPFGAMLIGKSANRIALTRFFAIFPDYQVNTEHALHQRDCVILTGQVRLTPDFSLLGFSGQSQTAKLPFSCMFKVENSLIKKEVFLLDVVDLCAQTRMPLLAVLDLMNKKYRRDEQSIFARQMSRLRTRIQFVVRKKGKGLS